MLHKQTITDGHNLWNRIKKKENEFIYFKHFLYSICLQDAANVSDILMNGIAADSYFLRWSSIITMFTETFWLSSLPLMPFIHLYSPKKDNTCNAINYFACVIRICNLYCDFMHFVDA